MCENINIRQWKNKTTNGKGKEKENHSTKLVNFENVSYQFSVCLFGEFSNSVSHEVLTCRHNHCYQSLWYVSAWEKLLSLSHAHTHTTQISCSLRSTSVCHRRLNNVNACQAGENTAKIENWYLFVAWCACVGIHCCSIANWINWNTKLKPNLFEHRKISFCVFRSLSLSFFHQILFWQLVNSICWANKVQIGRRWSIEKWCSKLKTLFESNRYITSVPYELLFSSIFHEK